MISPVKNIARLASRKESLNILNFIYGDNFDSTLCNAFSKHTFYGPINDNCLPQGWNFSLYPQPDNFYFIPDFNQSNIISEVNFDLVICHDRLSQYDLAKRIADILHINVIVVEHLANTTDINLMDFIPLLKKTKRDYTVYVADIKDQLKINGEVIRYGINDIGSTQKKDQIFTLETNLDVIKNIQSYTYMPIISKDISTISHHEYIKLLQESKFYLNLTAETARIQLPVLEAMSAKCVVISMTSPVIDQIITDKENGIIVQTPQDLITTWKAINNIDLTKIAENAYEYIQRYYNYQVFQKKWQKLLTDITKIPHIKI